MTCIDFHQPDWTHRTYRLYYYRLACGTTLLRWAWDSIDGLDSIGAGYSGPNRVTEYGNVS